MNIFQLKVRAKPIRKDVSISRAEKPKGGKFDLGETVNGFILPLEWYLFFARHSKDWQIESSFLILWVVVHGRS